MSEAVKQLLPAFLALSEAERVQLIELAEESQPARELAPELLAELDRRMGAVRRGDDPGVPAEEVFARLREKYS